MKGTILIGKRLGAMALTLFLVSVIIFLMTQLLPGDVAVMFLGQYAFATEPELVICDEPTSALDVSVQASTLNLLMDLQEQFGASYLFISHDLSVVKYISDRIAVMYLGKFVEIGRVKDIFLPPYYPYTKALLSAVPVPDPEHRVEMIRLAGTIPSAKNPPSGCRFHTRCSEKMGKICEEEIPPLRRDDSNHEIYCHRTLKELGTSKSII